MTARLTDAELSAIASDLAKCEVGLALTRGKLRRRYLDQRAACLAALKADAATYPACDLTDAELLAELAGGLTDAELLAELGVVS